jgi:hypothetical protein
MTPEEITMLFAMASASFQPIVCQPTDDNLTAIRDLLYPLLLDIPYDEAGTHNLIGLIEPTTTYTMTWGDPFPIPPQPPTYPAVPDDATAVVRTRREAKHAILVRDFATYEAAERATAKFLCNAVDEIWYRDLCHARSFYTNVTAMQLMEHLDANCGGLHPAELINLPTEMLGYYSDSIPEYINMLEEAQRKLAHTNLPMSDDQLLAIASTSILTSGHFPRPTDDWEALAHNNKTWAAWKTHYRVAHIARKRRMLAAGATVTTGMVNAVTGANKPELSLDTFTRLDRYLDNLAAATTNERNILTELIKNNATLTSSIATLTTSVVSLTAAYSILAAAKDNPPAPSGRKRNNNTNDNRPSYLAVSRYCWMHGYQVRKGHNSSNCRAKAEGHKDGATRANTMNGSTANKGWEDT